MKWIGLILLEIWPNSEEFTRVIDVLIVENKSDSNADFPIIGCILLNTKLIAMYTFLLLDVFFGI